MEKSEMPATKKEPNYRGMKAMPYVIGNETFEKLGTIGTTNNLLVYLTTVFNMNSTAANKILNTFHGTCNFGPLLGAFLSDTYFGRFNTIFISSISSFLGMLMLTMTAAFPKLHPEECRAKQDSPCRGASLGQLAFLYGGFVLLVIGASGIRPCNLAFGVDQFNPNTDSGRRGIAAFFNWYYFTHTFGMLLSLTVVVFVQSHHWAVGLAIPALLMLLSCALFLIGTATFVKVLPDGSPLANVVQTLVVAFKKRKLDLPQHPSGSDALFNHIPSGSINSTLPYTNQLRFLNKASIVTPEDEINVDGSAANPWRLRSLQQAEEIKCVVKVIPIWISGMIYNIALNQIQNYVVLQASQSNRYLGRNKFKIPQASYNVFTMVAMAVWIVFYDRALGPCLRRIRGKKQGLTILQRVGMGIVFVILAMIAAGVVEKHRRTLALTRPMGIERKGAVSSMSGNWLIPQLLVAGLSEGMGIIGLVEFYYSQFPENMRSMGSSLLFAGFALSFYLSNMLISVVDATTKGGWLAEDLNEGRLDLFYYLIAAVEMLNFVYFVVCAHWFNYTQSHS